MPSKSRRRPVASDRRFRRKSDVSDYGPAERWQHSGRVLELTERAGVLAARVTEEHIVDVMVTKKLLTKSQSDAAFKFKLDFQRAAMAVQVTGRYNPVRSNKDPFRGERERSDFEEAAYRRWRHAVRELGLGLGSVVITTVCHDLPPKADEIAVLQRGLEKLADWYKLPKDNSNPGGLNQPVDQAAARQ